MISLQDKDEDSTMTDKWPKKHNYVPLISLHDRDEDSTMTDET